MSTEGPRVTNKQREIAAKYNLPPCEFQVSFGGETPCCVWKWAWALSGTRSAVTGLAETKRQTGVSTACIPYTMADGCRDGIEEPIAQTPTLNSTTSPSFIT